MIEKTQSEIQSRELAVKLYDEWVRDRQRRRNIEFENGKRVHEKHRSDHFDYRVAEPRKKHLEQLKSLSKEMSTADKVALLVMMELPPLEISSLFHRLSIQLADSAKAAFFSKTNQVAACGCGCG